MAELRGDLEGIKICNDASSFNHLLFADDSLILLKVSEDSSHHLQNILNLYEQCLGQTVNVEKSSIMFSRNTKGREKAAMMNQLGLSRETRNERYLGLPVYVGKSKAKVFGYLKDRMWQKIQGWLEKLLSKVGKEILVKACAQAIPVFAMQCFDLTKGLCDQMSAMICRYWWAQQENLQKIHWLNWDTLTKPKKEGGLGYRDLHDFNIAMLAKQAWRLLTNPTSLCAQVLKAKYFPDCDVLHAEPKSGMSYTWRSILKGVQLLNHGIIKRVGNGLTMNIWSDPWLPRPWSRRPITPRGNAVVQRVSDLIDPYTNCWDEHLVRDLFWQEDAELILAIPIKEEMDDFFAWHYEPKGEFTVKSAYRLARALATKENEAECSSTKEQTEGFTWSAIWKAPCPPNVQQFLWRMAHNSLPLRCNIKRRGMDIDTICLSK
jgi:hypothetical protein